MKIAISIPDAVFEAAERLAARLGKSRSQLYAEAVTEYLADHRADAVTEKLDAVYSMETSAPDRALETMQRRSMDDEQW